MCQQRMVKAQPAIFTRMSHGVSAGLMPANVSASERGLPKSPVTCFNRSACPIGAGHTTVQALFAGSFSLLVRRRRAMTIAQHVGYAPSAALLRPDHHEFGDTFAASRGQLAETVLAFFDRTVILDRIDPEGGANQFAF